ncbi:MAG TPA: ABC transporter permease subunit, partial [Planctomycetota bacterium]|nr:ABC transporter permease subunit [Planctomycetota bacterium]
ADAASAFPPLFTATAAAALFRPSLLGLTLTLGALRAPFIARLVRQDARRAAAAPFVFAARASGARGAAIVLRHVVPHAAAPALVAAAFAVTGNVLAEAALSFLGVGLPEPTATLGGLLRDGRAAAPAAPHLVVIPGLVVVALTWSCHVLAETARRKLRPWTAEAPR